MPKKSWSDEERKAFGEKMRKARLDKATHSSYPPEVPEDVPAAPPVSEQPVAEASSGDDIGELLARIKELEARLPVRQLEAPQLDSRGQLVGTYERYRTDPTYYPDPRKRLAQEPRLQRFAFGDNYDLTFDVGLTSYQTLDGRNVKEPKFTLKLLQVVYDEDTGERKRVFDETEKVWKEQRFTRTQMVFHEDPTTALTIAYDIGFDVDSVGEKEFLDEMRYLRMRDFLLECFYPPAPPKASDRKEMVIGNRLVEIFTVNIEEGDTVPAVPFDSLKKL